ncbi:putative ankyrin repeat protein RF_0381 [Impatiens glandulifera]|uniref:putative ankyrin repeat protein RF_0381 n=1 Tax=Impatiens glandulifera TaxID=253017 RepID=UPI001FB06B6F|nr:putative ankyrin repeat protein RF_0381 [Impatiens glandulifera]
MGKPQKSSEAGGDLHAAARSGDLMAVQRICSSNPLAINSRDKHSRAPLHLASWAGQAQVVDYLCKNKADVGAAAMDDMGAIHFASQKGHLEVVRTLVSSGVSIKSANRKGMTALHYAVQGSHLDLIKYLVKKGANATEKTKAGKTAHDLAPNEQVGSFLVECEKSKENNSKLSPSHEGEEVEKEIEKEEEKGDVNEDGEMGNGDDESLKRKGDEEIIGENSSAKKKVKVSLNHLLACDDTQDEDE